MTGFTDVVPDNEATVVQLLEVVAECKKNLLPTPVLKEKVYNTLLVGDAAMSDKAQVVE